MFKTYQSQQKPCLNMYTWYTYNIQVARLYILEYSPKAIHLTHQTHYTLVPVYAWKYGYHQYRILKTQPHQRGKVSEYWSPYHLNFPNEIKLQHSSKLQIYSLFQKICLVVYVPHLIKSKVFTNFTYRYSTTHLYTYMQTYNQQLKG